MISCKNDPDYVQLSMTNVEINKNYFELITKYLSNSSSSRSAQSERGSTDPQSVIRNDQANYVISKASLERLRPRKWLNDEIVNAYIALVNMR